MVDPIKITVSPAIPKNEIDLLCMILAGRLRDLWNGKLFCAQLAVDDLLQDLTGVDVFPELKNALNELHGALEDFRTSSEYGNILNKINQSLSQISSVFSLGGLCPNPITPPRIPDMLATLNQNLFGQANNIINALARASSPQMCFGPGPGGFGVNWNSLTGDLKNLRGAVDNLLSNPAGANDVLNQFELNIRTQTRRLRAELDRLGRNLSDPLGITGSQSTARKIERLSATASNYPVKDRRGIEFDNVVDPMVTGDVNFVLGRKDRLSVTPITFKIQEIKDYCGEIVGYEKVSVSGDPEYIGYTTDPRFENLNVDNPTTNPTSTYPDYDFTFEDSTGTVKVFDRTGAELSVINLTRGKSYKIGFKLQNNNVKIYDTDSQVWTHGITYGSDPVYGVGADGPGQIIIDENSTLQPDYKMGELEWSVLLENPTTPNILKWQAGNGQTGDIVIGGATSIPDEDKSYDISTSFRKGLMHYQTVVENNVFFDRVRTTGRYNVRLNLKLSDGTEYNLDYDENTVPHVFGKKVRDMIMPATSGWSNWISQHPGSGGSGGGGSVVETTPSCVTKPVDHRNTFTNNGWMGGTFGEYLGIPVGEGGGQKLKWSMNVGSIFAIKIPKYPTVFNQKIDSLSFVIYWPVFNIDPQGANPTEFEVCISECEGDFDSIITGNTKQKVYAKTALRELRLDTTYEPSLLLGYQIPNTAVLDKNKDYYLNIRITGVDTNTDYPPNFGSLGLAYYYQSRDRGGGEAAPMFVSTESNVVFSANIGEGDGDATEYRGFVQPNIGTYGPIWGI